jgi:hypothetical protein
MGHYYKGTQNENVDKAAIMSISTDTNIRIKVKRDGQVMQNDSKFYHRGKKTASDPQCCLYSHLSKQQAGMHV